MLQHVDIDPVFQAYAMPPGTLVTVPDWCRLSPRCTASGEWTRVQVLAWQKRKPSLAALEVFQAQATLLPNVACWQELVQGAADARAWLQKAQPSLQGGQVCQI